MKRKNLKIILSVSITGGIVACILVWAILTQRMVILPTKKPWLVVTDDLGRTVTIAKQPERIISLSPANTEILFALELGKKVVGVTNVCNYPSQAEGKERIGNYDNPSLEKIIELEPDLILASHGNPDQVIDDLVNLGYIVVGLNPKSVDEIADSIIMVGRITGRNNEAAKLAEEMNKRIEAVVSRTGNLAENSKPRVLYVVWYPPLWTAGSETFIDELIQKAGGTNIAKDLTGWPQMNRETVIERNPQVIIVGYSKDQPELITAVKNESLFHQIDAFKYDRIYTIDTDTVSRTGPRIVDALEEMAKIIHPDIFK